MGSASAPRPAAARQCRDSGVHGQQVVHPRPGHEFAVPSQVGGGLHAVRHQVPAGDVLHRQSALLGEEAQQVALLGPAEAPHGCHVALAVQLEAVVDLPVEVDGELRYAQQGAVHVHQVGGAVAQGQPAAEAQVAVEPGVEQGAAVDLDGDLPPVVGAGVGHGLDPQVGRVGVGADDPEGGARQRAFGDVPGDERAAAEDVLAARGGVPRLGLAHLPEAGLLQLRGRVRHRVVGGGAGGEEGQQTVGVPAVERCGVAHGPTLRRGVRAPGVRSSPLGTGGAPLPGAAGAGRGGRVAARRQGRGRAQNAFSSSSMIERSTVSASSRWTATCGSTFAAKNFAAAILPW